MNPKNGGEAKERIKKKKRFRLERAIMHDTADPRTTRQAPFTLRFVTFLSILYSEGDCIAAHTFHTIIRRRSHPLIPTMRYKGT